MLVIRSCAVILFAVSWLAPSSVRAGTCNAAGTAIDADFNFGTVNAGASGHAVDFDVAIFVTADGTALPVGTAVVQNGGRSRESLLLVAVSEGTGATCDDVDRDGIAGLTGLVVELRDAASGDPVTAVIKPTGAGDIHRTGRYPATVTLQGPRFPGITVPGVIGLPRRPHRP